MNGLTPEQEVEYYQLLEDEIRYQEANPLEYFYPNQPQLDLIHQLNIREQTTKRRFFLTCANRVGKTTGIAAITAAIVTENRTGFFSQLPEWNYSKTCWIVAKKRNIDENINPILQKYLAGVKYEVSKKGQTYDSHYDIIETGWQIEVRTYDMEDEDFESGTVGLLMLDEPPPERIWQALKSRLMQGGLLFCGATPLYSAGYLMDEVVTPAAEDPESIYWHRTAPMSDNIIEDAGVYTLAELAKLGYQKEEIEDAIGKPKGNITKLEAELAIKEFKDPDTYRARVFGEFMFLAGAILKTFKPHTHVIPSFNLNLGEYRIVNVIDPHDRRPPFIVWLAVDADDRWYVIDEWPKPQDFNNTYYHKIKYYEGTISDVCLEIKNIEMSHGFHKIAPDIIRIMDPNFGAKPNQATGRTTAQEYAYRSRSKDVNYPLLFRPGNNDLSTGILKYKELLAPDEFNDPNLLFFDRCQNTINAVLNWKYKEFRGVSQEGRNLSEKVEELHKDPNDCIRYGIVTDVKAPLTKSQQTWIDDIQKELRTGGKITKRTGKVY